LAFGLAHTLGSGSGALGGAVESVRRRVFFVPGDVMVQFFASFPGRRPFLEGQSIPKIPRLFGAETFDLSGYIYEVAYQFDERVVGSANGSFIGVGWANFGAMGVIAWCVVAALGLILVERWLEALPLISAAALRGVTIIQAVLLTSADLSRTILSIAPGLLDLFIAVSLITIVYRRRSIKGAPNVGPWRPGSVATLPAVPGRAE
jgi:hypothetical protein